MYSEPTGLAELTFHAMVLGTGSDSFDCTCTCTCTNGYVNNGSHQWRERFPGRDEKSQTSACDLQGGCKPKLEIIQYLMVATFELVVKSGGPCWDPRDDTLSRIHG